jgi:hypothetical protein
MCRNIKRLFNLEPPATDEDTCAAALQFVRKIAGFRAPSSANREAFDRAVDAIAQASRELLGSLVTGAPSFHHDGAVETARKRSIPRSGS